ncbi:hypothetical protein PRO73_22515, partial [Pseudomonas aeruginosa]|nr:hypothetical protein [Pseudomonas aeruginosa]
MDTGLLGQLARHLALLVPNLEECERFYVDVLGMEV